MMILESERIWWVSFHLCWMSFMLSVTNKPFVLSVFMLSVIMLNVMALSFFFFFTFAEYQCWWYCAECCYTDCPLCWVLCFMLHSVLFCWLSLGWGPCLIVSSFYCYAECLYAECCYAECQGFIVSECHSYAECLQAKCR